MPPRARARGDASVDDDDDDGDDGDDDDRGGGRAGVRATIDRERISRVVVSCRLLVLILLILILILLLLLLILLLILLLLLLILLLRAAAGRPRGVQVLPRPRPRARLRKLPLHARAPDAREARRARASRLQRRDRERARRRLGAAPRVDAPAVLARRPPRDPRGGREQTPAPGRGRAVARPPRGRRAREAMAEFDRRRANEGAFYTLVPIRPRSRGER
eukprot:31450-Pelagococcus_subviridis.AAC.20